MFFFNLGWDLHQIVLDGSRLATSALALQGSNIRAEDLLGDVNILGSNWTVLQYVLAKDGLEIRDGWAPDNMVESAGRFGILKLAFGKVELVLFDRRDNMAALSCRLARRRSRTFTVGYLFKEVVRGIVGIQTLWGTLEFNDSVLGMDAECVLNIRFISDPILVGNVSKAKEILAIIFVSSQPVPKLGTWPSIWSSFPPALVAMETGVLLMRKLCIKSGLQMVAFNVDPQSMRIVSLRCVNALVIDCLPTSA